MQRRVACWPGGCWAKPQLAQLYRVSWQVVRISIWIAVGLAALYGLGYACHGAVHSRCAGCSTSLRGVFWMVVLYPIDTVAFRLRRHLQRHWRRRCLAQRIAFLHPPLENLRSATSWSATRKAETLRHLDRVPAGEGEHGGAWLTVLFRRRYKHHGVVVT
ncbi:MAG: hypothetical protein IPI07_04075 [Flavobacteriales bacterium]|nr:hypothetical protein [Flavobacteriales bacterium]